MKALVVSDVHDLEYELTQIVTQLKPDLIIDGGDHSGDSIHSLYQEVPRYFTFGNHEPQDIIDIVEVNEPHTTENIHYLINGKLNTIVHGHESLDVLAWGGNYSQNFWEKGTVKEKNKNLKPLRLDPETYQAMLTKLKRVDLFLTHEAPVAAEIEFQKKNAGIAYIDKVAEIQKPQFHVSGHLHTYSHTSNSFTNRFALPYLTEGVGILEVKDGQKSFEMKFEGTDYDL